MIAMLAQGFGHFKQMEGMEHDDLLCSRNTRSRKALAGHAPSPTHLSTKRKSELEKLLNRQRLCSSGQSNI